MATKAQRRIRAENRKEFFKGEFNYLDHDLALESEEITQYQIRYRNPKTGKAVDLYPSSRKFFDLRTKQRGEYEDAEELLTRLLL